MGARPIFRGDAAHETELSQNTNQAPWSWIECIPPALDRDGERKAPLKSVVWIQNPRLGNHPASLCMPSVSLVPLFTPVGLACLSEIGMFRGVSDNCCVLVDYSKRKLVEGIYIHL